ncbi:Ger(x)C family spore germination C-terminal domain-containing protein [Bacillus sp. B6(2022)]|nr:Ger(x)C family spore germination C-terminal domain-containing protein [Bacillus sp. B6(2022)]
MGISFLVQSVEVVNGELTYDGAGIIHGKTRKLIGFIPAKDVQSLNWVMNRISGGVVPATYKDFPITYEIKKAKSKIEPYLKNGKVSFKISVQTNGKLSEDQYPLKTHSMNSTSNDLSAFLNAKSKSAFKKPSTTCKKKLALTRSF